jgi:hypothetical protein
MICAGTAEATTFQQYDTMSAWDQSEFLARLKGDEELVASE